MRILQLITVLCILWASPAYAQLTINEFLADNASTIADENGDFEDWIEIHNAGANAVDIGGYYISDDLTAPTIWQIPTTNPSLTTVPAGGFLLLWADKDTDDGELHIDIKLGSGGEDIVLVNPDGVTIVDQLTFGPQSTDVSYGRTVDGGPDFQIFTASTPNASNETPAPDLTFSITLNAEISTLNDDAVQYGVGNGSVNINQFGMKITEAWSNQIIGLRFSDILIPQGATITNAKIQFSTKNPDDSVGEADFEIRGQLSGDAAPFEEVSQNISSRPTTNSMVPWQPEEWLLSEEKGLNQKTPNLASLIQEAVSLSSWESGNAIAFIITGNGTRSADNFTSGVPATIIIEAEVPAPTELVTDIYINEISPNGTDFTDEHGGYEDWIEIYNDGDSPVSLGGLYLTDNIDDLTKWQISSIQPVPANGHLTIFADEETYLGGLHADFKLSDDGETLALVQAIGNQLIIIDSISYGPVPFKASAGRSSDGAADWVIFGEQTPEAPNAGALSWLAAPDISLDHGAFSTPQTVAITHIDPTVTLRYTTDSSIPDENSAEYAGEITVSETQSIRARAFKSGFEASQTKTRNYLFDLSETLPVLMITTDPDNLFDDEIGIYTIGTNGTDGATCTNNVIANFWQDWERPANLTLFEVGGEEAFSVNAGIKISGNCSRRYALKSLNIYLRNNLYGDKDLDYKIFPDRDFKKYKRLRLRNSGQDYRGTMMRDGVNHRMLKDITDVEYQNFRPTLVYINGEYYGIQNFKDLYGGDYFDDFHDVKEEELDLIKSPRLKHDIKEGDDVHYNNLYSFVLNNDLSDPSNYEYFKTQFEIDNFIDYWIAMIYMSSSDWPANNIQLWRPRTPEGKWRHMYIDTDATTNAYGENSNTGPMRDTYKKVLDGTQVGWPYDAKSTVFIRNLLENQEFKDEYIQRTCSFIELVFGAERVHEFIDAAAADIDAEIGEHVEHWAFDNPYLLDYEDWTNKRDKYKKFFVDRPTFFYDLMVLNFDLGETYELTFDYTEETKGDVFVNWNQMEVPFNYTGTYFTGIPMRITAVADEGYTFAYWLENGDTNPEIDFIANSDETLTPIFEPIGDICTPGSPDFLDEDGDGVCDLEDECPGFDDTVDTNNNNIPDGCEPCFLEGDDDNDGVCNDTDQCPGFDDNVDTNNNGIPDGCEDCLDGDDDNDGVCNSEDQCPGFDDNVDTNNNGIPDGCEECFPVGDDDNDGVCNDVDQCPGFDDNVDVNNNGIPDGCEECVDGDNDNDGVCTIDDCDDNNPNLPTTPGTSCDDENASTINDVIQADGCTCQGEIEQTGGDYCESEGDFPYHEWIEVVQLNNLINTSGKTNYSDFTNLFASLDSGESYDLTLTTGYSYTTYDEYFRVWIDYNQNGVFEEPSEIAYSGIVTAPPNGTDTADLIGSIDVPANALEGNTRMRISMQRGAYAPPCGNFPVGEVEDYTVIISTGDGTSISLQNCTADREETAAPGQTEIVFSWESPIATTTCDPNTTTIVQSAGPPSGSAFAINTVTTITYTATDECGNSESCSFTITVNEADNGEIDLTCLGNITITAPAGQTGTDISWDAATGSTTCPSNGLNISQTGGQPSGSFFEIGNYQIVYVATDDCGNSETCSFNITVNEADNGEIDLTCPGNITITAPAGQTGTNVSWTAASASTTCPSNGLNISQTGGLPSGSFFEIGNYQIDYEATDDCGNSETCSFNIQVLADTGNGDYCESEGDFPWHEWIEGVQLNTINNPSSKSTYSDFTDISTNLERETPYTIALTTGYSYFTYDEYWKVWIDYNQNGTFEEPSEIAFEGVVSAPPNGTDNGFLNGSITVPTDASLGATRMRISMKRGASPSPCEVIPFGEVEDYTVVIDPAINNAGSGESSAALYRDVEIPDNDDVLLFPNPSKGIFNVHAPKFVGLPTNITVYNHLGHVVKVIEKDEFPETPVRVNMKGHQNGFFYVAVKAEGRKLITKKFSLESRK